MRTPIRSETDAFWVSLGVMLAIVLAVAIGWATTPLAGVAVFVLVLVVAAGVYLRAARGDRRPVLRRALHEPHPRGGPPGTRRVLVIANQAMSGPELRARLVDRGAPVEVEVLAPVLTSHVHYGVSDFDRELTLSRARLKRSLAWARDQGLAAHGTVGDPSHTTAIEDELRDYGPDEVIVVTHPPELETWQERDQLQRLRGELDVPVTQIVATGGEDRAER